MPKRCLSTARIRHRKRGTASDGSSFHPGLHYYVGGNSKVYGAALFRLRERDFGEVVHQHGISPAWPLGYDVFEPFYAEAERLFAVHGQRGEDPTGAAVERALSAIPPSPMSRASRRSATRLRATVCTRFTCRSAFGWTNATAR